MLFYPVVLPLSRQSLTFTAGIIRRYRRKLEVETTAPAHVTGRASRSPFRGLAGRRS